MMIKTRPYCVLVVQWKKDLPDPNQAGAICDCRIFQTYNEMVNWRAKNIDNVDLTTECFERSVE